ncbi:hypothetical protein Gasu2_00940 [Galdieria sulphuraria]|nr:hypothetical protein Gasu2_00940 [Galdieria sulphuraria]
MDAASSQRQLKEKMEHQKLLENKENEARQEIFSTCSKVMDGSLKSKISSCSEDNGNSEEERMDPMLLKEREAANYLAQHADMVRNGTWKKMQLEKERKMREENERKLKEAALLKESNDQNIEKGKIEQENNPTQQSAVEPSRRKILRFLCCTVVEESY